MRYEDDSLTGLESHQRGGKPGGGSQAARYTT